MFIDSKWGTIDYTPFCETSNPLWAVALNVANYFAEVILKCAALCIISMESGVSHKGTAWQRSQAD